MLTVIEESTQLRKVPPVRDTDIIRIATQSSITIVSHLHYYADRIIDLYHYRKLLSIGDYIKVASAQRTLKPKEIIKNTVELVEDIQQEQEESEISGNEALDEFIQDYDDIISGKKTPSIKTGFNELDQTIGGWQGPDLIMIAGRPGMGKTAVSMQMMMHACTLQKKALVFSLEMSKIQLIQRLISSHGGFSSFDLREGKVDTQSILPIIHQLRQHLKYMHIDDSSFINIDHIRERTKEIQPDIIMLDYVQLIKGDDQTTGRNYQLNEISNSLKQTAKEYNIPILCLSQLNRSSDDRKNKRPRMSDLKDSGSLEQDADLVVLLYRDSYYHENVGNETELIISKNRHGPTGTINIQFDSTRVTFTN